MTNSFSHFSFSGGSPPRADRSRSLPAPSPLLARPVRRALYGKRKIVYCLHNILTGLDYVGKTEGTLERRFYQHQVDPRCVLIHRALKKYGPEAFTKRVLATARTRRELNALEKKFIRELGTLHPGGYNLMEGGDGGKQSASVRRRMSRKARTLGQLPAVREARAERARKQDHSPLMTPAAMAKKRGPKSAAHRAKLAKLCRARNRSAAFRKYLSNCMSGRQVSEETCRKISAAKRGGTAWNKGLKTGPLPRATCRKMSAAQRGKSRPRTPEHQAALTAALQAPEVRKKISKARKAFWAKRKGECQ